MYEIFLSPRFDEYGSYIDPIGCTYWGIILE